MRVHSDRHGCNLGTDDTDRIRSNSESDWIKLKFQPDQARILGRIVTELCVRLDHNRIAIEIRPNRMGPMAYKVQELAIVPIAIDAEEIDRRIPQYEQELSSSYHLFYIFDSIGHDLSSD